MATIYYKIFKHHKKADGKYNIKYCLTHKGKQLYISSQHHVSDSQLIKTTFKLRDQAVLAEVMSDVSALTKKMNQLGPGIAAMSADEVLQYITTEARPEAIDFIAFCRTYVQELKDSGRDGTARSLNPVVNILVDFFGSESVPVNEITSKSLRQLEAYLSKSRRIVRRNQFGDESASTRPGMSASGLHTTMRGLRVLFNACRQEYNTEVSQPITHYPFDYYKLPKPALTRKRGGDLTADDVAAIRDMPARPGSRKELARDMFMLSFYLCGMNAKDIFDRSWVVEDGRIQYGRSKTRGRRSDGALISVSVPAEAAVLLDRYTERHLRNRYSGYDTFLTAITKGMGEVAAAIGKDVTFYHARHTFATLAFNKCGFSKDAVGMALNHVDQSRKVTDRYIAADWSIVDKVQAGVLALLPAKNPV